MSTITKEQAQKIIDAADAVITALAGTNEDVHPESDNMLHLWDALNDRYAPPEVVRELARIALASLEAEIHSYTFEDDPRPLYTAPPVSAFEIKDLEHFISFWRKVQAGQMNPGKNDIDHTVWFLEGLSDLTAPPAPVSVPDFSALDRLAGEMLTHAMNCERRVSVAYTHCAHRLAEEVRDLRAAMLQGAEPVTTAYKLPEGWVAVPVEPTEDMIVNGFESEPDESFSDAEVWEAYDAMSGCQQAAHRAKLCWAAMIAAAPKLEA